MKSNDNKYLFNKRIKILNIAKKIIKKTGLTNEIYQTISDKYNFDLNEIEVLFPDGKNDLLKFSLEVLNKDLEQSCKKINLIRLPVHKRIRIILLTKINLMRKEKEFYKKIFLNIILPKKNFSLSRQLYQSVDQMWFIAGDNSVDFNYYTKRLILAGIYSRIIFFFFNNNDQEGLE